MHMSKEYKTESLVVSPIASWLDIIPVGEVGSDVVFESPAGST